MTNLRSVLERLRGGPLRVNWKVETKDGESASFLGRQHKRERSHRANHAQQPQPHLHHFSFPASYDAPPMTSHGGYNEGPPHCAALRQLYRRVLWCFLVIHHVCASQRTFCCVLFWSSERKRMSFMAMAGSSSCTTNGAN